MWDDMSVLPAAFWPGRASPHSGSARPEKRRWAPSLPSFLRALPGLSGLLLYLPKSILPSSHDRLFPESFIHSHCFHNCPGTCVPGSPPPRSLNGSGLHFQLPPRCQPRNVLRHSQIPSSSGPYASPKPAPPPPVSCPSRQKPGTMLGSPSFPPHSTTQRLLGARKPTS